jgi:hypothetical protein
MTTQREFRVFEPEGFMKELILPVAPVERALRMITAVHRLVGDDSLRIHHRRFRGARSGCYSSSLNEIAFHGPSKGSEFTFIHEYGHFLDFKIFSETGRACSCTPHSKLSGIIKTLRQTPTYAGLCSGEDFSKSRARYFRSAVELWARAYTQFIVARAAGDAAGAKAHIKGPGLDWPPEEFAPAARAIGDLLDSMEWQ